MSVLCDTGITVSKDPMFLFAEGITDRSCEKRLGFPHNPQSSTQERIKLSNYRQQRYCGLNVCFPLKFICGNLILLHAMVLGSGALGRLGLDEVMRVVSW